MKTREDKYWICSSCAAEMGWICDKNGITLIAGLCGWCDNPDEEPLTPTRDFNKLHYKDLEADNV